ncbi:MAG: hypothetical protein JNK48_05565 [Bryobacterales bacterium]|nr:hypothetical protein [Bryobacterales bacterium]
MRIVVSPNTENPSASFPDPKASCLQLSLDIGIAGLTKALAAVVFALAAASAGAHLITRFTGRDHLLGLIPMFQMEHEGNVPALFSGLLLLASALLLLVIVRSKQASADPFARHWTVLCCGFFLMTLDELVRLHEMMSAPMRLLLGQGKLGLFYFSWVLPALAMISLLGIYFVKFLLHLPRPSMYRFVAAGGLYLSGCVGMEMLGGWRAETHGSRDPIFLAFSTTEETMEMTGIILFLRALLLYLRDYAPRLQFATRLNP